MPKEKHTAKSRPNAKGNNTKKVALFTGVGLLLGGTAFGVYWFGFRNKKGNDSLPADFLKNDSAPALPAPAGNSGSASGGSSAYRSDNHFPLSVYVKGEKVRLIQKALNEKFNAGLKADGLWGPKTNRALQNAGFPTTLSQADFDRLVAGVSASAGFTVPSGATPELGAKTLARAIQSQDYKLALVVLKAMKSPQDYVAVRNSYKSKYGRTVVDAMLGRTSPWSTAQKAMIRQEFLRMGLLYDRSRDRWSLPAGLSGFAFSGRMVTALDSTIAFDGHGELLPVAAGEQVGILLEQSPQYIRVQGANGKVWFLPPGQSSF